MKAENSHYLLFASWKASSAIQSEVKGLRTQEHLGQEKTNVLAQAIGQKGWNSFFLPFCSNQALNRLDTAHLHWGGQTALLSH